MARARNTRALPVLAVVMNEPNSTRLHPRSCSRAALAGALLLASLALVPPALAGRTHAPRGRSAELASGKPQATATLEQCQTSGAQSQRSATFVGEMLTQPGTQRMQMSVQVLERTEGEALYHVVSAPGLGVWRSSAPGVQNYKYLRQVTNLTGPAFYRATIRFRWLNARNHVIASLELHTRRCEQPPSAETGAQDGAPVT